MSERHDREERARREAEERRTLGPDIDAEGRRMDQPRGNDVPRRVGAEREEHEESRSGERSSGQERAVRASGEE